MGHMWLMAHNVTEFHGSHVTHVAVNVLKHSLSSKKKKTINHLGTYVTFML